MNFIFIRCQASEDRTPFFTGRNRVGELRSTCGGELPQDKPSGKSHGGKVTMKDLDLLRSEVWAW